MERQVERRIVYAATAAMTALTAAAGYTRPAEASPEPAARGAMLQLTSAQLAQVRGGTPCEVGVTIINNWFSDLGGPTGANGQPLFQPELGEQRIGATEGREFTVSAGGAITATKTSAGRAAARLRSSSPDPSLSIEGSPAVRVRVENQQNGERYEMMIPCGGHREVTIDSAVDPKNSPAIKNPSAGSSRPKTEGAGVRPAAPTPAATQPARRDGEVDPRLQDWLGWTGEKLSGAERFLFENRETGLIIVLIIGGFILVPRTLAGLWRLIRGH